MIYDLIDERRPVYVGGRRFLIRRVSLADVLRAYAMLGKHLHLVDGETVEAGTRLLQAIDRQETAEILSWVMEPQDPSWIAEHLEDAPAVVRAIAGMNDMHRIFLELKPSPPPAAPERAPAASEEPAGPSGLERMIDLVARRYSVPPHQVCAWPFEEVLTIASYIEYEFKQMESAPDSPFARPTAGGRRKIKLGSSTDAVEILSAGGEYRGPTH